MIFTDECGATFKGDQISEKTWELPPVAIAVMTKEEIEAQKDSKSTFVDRKIDLEGEVCQCCQYPAKDLQTYKYNNVHRNRVDDFLFCKICASTYLSNLVMYSSLYSSEYSNLASGIGYIGNLLSDKLDKLIATRGN